MVETRLHLDRGQLHRQKSTLEDPRALIGRRVAAVLLRVCPVAAFPPKQRQSGPPACLRCRTRGQPRGTHAPSQIDGSLNTSKLSFPLPPTAPTRLQPPPTTPKRKRQDTSSLPLSLFLSPTTVAETILLCRPATIARQSLAPCLSIRPRSEESGLRSRPSCPRHTPHTLSKSHNRGRRLAHGSGPPC